MFVCVCLCVCVCDFTWIFPMQIHLYTNNRRACFYVVNVCVCVCACACGYLLCRITVNHVRQKGDLPIQERGRSQVQWNLVCHHHCDVHSWRNSLNCPTWESTETERQRDREKTRVECWSVNYYCHVYAIKLPELIKGAKNCENDWQLFSLLRLFTNLLANVARL